MLVKRLLLMLILAGAAGFFLCAGFWPETMLVSLMLFVVRALFIMLGGSLTVAALAYFIWINSKPLGMHDVEELKENIRQQAVQKDGRTKLHSVNGDQE